ncbi:MAG: hypothetical protein HC837_07910 [Chloroflexaceae bacterium]|nr:hypothetical protein [Chloroflexaceae bacterium]
MPPHPREEVYEQGIAVRRALHQLHQRKLVDIQMSDDPERYEWPQVVWVTSEHGPGRVRYRWHSDDADAEAALTSFWRIFSAIRVFRQLGTAQAVAVYTNLFTGRVLGMSWEAALDTALADTLADQLQVMARDEQRTIDAYVEHAGDPEQLRIAMDAICQALPLGRQHSLLYALREAEQQRHGTHSINPGSNTAPESAQLERVFVLGTPLHLPAAGVFQRRLRALIGERGL